MSKLGKKYGVEINLNTVVKRDNFDEDMNEGVEQLDPSQWKCFRGLTREVENGSQKTIYDASRFDTTDEEYKRFCKTHSNNESFVADSNKATRSSYLILDEYMRFLNKRTGEPTQSILDVGVLGAMENVN